MKRLFIPLFLIAIVALSGCKKVEPEVVEDSPFVKRLKQINGVSNVKSYKFDDVKYTKKDWEEYNPIMRQTYSEFIEFDYAQPVQHGVQNGKWLYQRVRIMYRDTLANTVFDTQGYNLSPKMEIDYNSLAVELKANIVTCEHRYFLQSTVEGDNNWTYFNAKEAAGDHHNLVAALKPLFRKKWIATGLSKSGITTGLYAYYHPNDMDCYVPFCAPFLQGRYEESIGKFLTGKVGTKEQRDTTLTSQKFALQKDTLDKMAKIYQTKAKRVVSLDVARQQVTSTIVSFFFDEWSYKNVNTDFWLSYVPYPSKGYEEYLTADSLYKYYFSKQSDKKAVRPDDEDDALGYPYHVQAYKELGYYVYDADYYGVNKNYLTTADSTLYAEDLAKLKGTQFDNVPMNGVRDMVKNTQNKMMFVYGANDPWTAGGISSTGLCGNVKYVLIPQGTHSDELGNFPADKKAEILNFVNDCLK